MLEQENGLRVINTEQTAPVIFTPKEEMTLLQKLEILTDSAKYDVSCSSSGVERKGMEETWGIVKKQVFVTASVAMADAFPC